MLHELLLALVGLSGNILLEGPSEDAVTDSAASGDEPTLDNRFKVPENIFRKSSPFLLGDPKKSEIERLLPLGLYYREIQAFVSETRSLSWRVHQTSTRLPDGLPSKTGGWQTLSQRLSDGGRASKLVHSEQSASRGHESQKKSSNLVAEQGQALQDESSPAESGSSMYQHALAIGLDEVLAVYRAAIVKAEQEILQDPLPRVSIVAGHMKLFQILLPALHALVRQVRKNGLRGGQVLQLLHQESICGIPILKDCLTRLLWHCHFTMLRQLNNWMVYGILKDPHNEFFIMRGGRSDGAECLDVGKPDWHSDFCVREEMLPSYIPLRVAEMILFVGKAVRILRNPSQGFVSQAWGDHSRMSSKATSRASSTAGTPPQLENFLLPEAMLNHQELLPQAQAEQIAASLCQLQEAPELHVLSLEQAVEAAHSIAARHLWQLIMVHADVTGTLSALKDYFLLGKGDLFQFFLEKSRTFMRLPPNPSTAEADVQSAFQEAAMKTGCEDDAYFSKVSLRMPRQTHMPASAPSTSGTSSSSSRQRLGIGLEAGSGKKVHGLDGWDDIVLDYRVDWPLPLLITGGTLSKYALMFSHLLRLKRIQVELEQAWNLARERERHDSRTSGMTGAERAEARERRRKRQTLWSLRRSMTDLVTNLQYYIQVDVLETQWVLLQDRIAASRDFTEIARFHQEFLESLLTQSFQNFAVVLNVVDPTLQCCQRFCREVERSSGTPAPASLQEIAKVFQKQSKSLYMLLNSPRLAGTPHAPYLRQLLLRLNFNCYYERTVVEEGTPRSSR